ncbi:alpha-ketoglutarate dehydrogenase complex subunit Kgd1 [Aspergillus luchuensis]|uniref:Alpha-ketoglutarate dehydrogenase complex subunit Kgd1 n=1 Tax=Aspergillus kawachii TaxID=1069201 RepID=A0A146F528_ASPKA|nr:alpha-ketoglutarate dehydrogenase complex subunit Kgd1 [Aspergillus luchuensis]
MKGEFIISSRSYIDRESSVGRAALATFEVAPVIDHSLTHLTALDALEAAFAGLLTQEAAAERRQARWHRDIRGPSAGEGAVAGTASVVRSESDRMTEYNTGITYRRVGLLGVSLGRITTLRRRIALGRVPVRRPSQNNAQIRSMI